MKTRSLLAGAALAAFVAVPLARADYASTVLSQGPVGYWRLNETLQPPASTAAANSGGSLGASANGTYNNFPTKGLTGPFAGSSAVGVDGVNQSVTSGYQAGLNPVQFTIEAWVRPASATVSGGLLCVAASMYSTSPRQGWLIYHSDGTAAGAALPCSRAGHRPRGRDSMIPIMASAMSNWRRMDASSRPPVTSCSGPAT